MRTFSIKKDFSYPNIDSNLKSKLLDLSHRLSINIDFNNHFQNGNGGFIFPIYQCYDNEIGNEKPILSVVTTKGYGNNEIMLKSYDLDGNCSWKDELPDRRDETWLDLWGDKRDFKNYASKLPILNSSTKLFDEFLSLSPIYY